MRVKRGDIYLVDFEPSLGAEIRKVRPALIISCDEANRNLKTVMVIPFTSRVERVYPFDVFVGREESELNVDSKLKISQMRAVDKGRLKRYVGMVTGERLTEVEKAIRLHLAME